MFLEKIQVYYTVNANFSVLIEIFEFMLVKSSVLNTTKFFEVCPNKLENKKNDITNNSVRISDSIVPNEQGLAFGGEFEKRPPVTTAQ